MAVTDQTEPTEDISDTFALLFFVMAIIYLCFFVGLVFRTAVPLFSCKKYPNDRTMQMFRAFYGAIWIQTFLNGLLYWVLFVEFAQNTPSPSGKDSGDGFTSTVLIFTPYVLMSFDYSIMYLQLEELQLRSRQQGGVAYINQENHAKLQKIVNIITVVYAAGFIVL